MRVLWVVFGTRALRDLRPTAVLWGAHHYGARLISGRWPMAVEKHITIPEEQAKFVDEMNLTLSGVVQDHLDELMQRYNYHPADDPDPDAKA